jgi:glutaredoxin
MESEYNPIIKKIIFAKKGTFIIFFIYECPYSRKALDLLKNNNLSYKGYDINTINGGMEKLLEVLKKNAELINFDIRHKTKPIIFLNGKYLGGFEELSKYLMS